MASDIILYISYNLFQLFQVTNVSSPYQEASTTQQRWNPSQYHVCRYVLAKTYFCVFFNHRPLVLKVLYETCMLLAPCFRRAFPSKFIAIDWLKLHFDPESVNFFESFDAWQWSNPNFYLSIDCSGLINLWLIWKSQRFEFGCDQQSNSIMIAKY